MSSAGRITVVPASSVPLQAQYETASPPTATPDVHILAQVRFGVTTTCDRDPRLLELALPPLGDSGLLETWRCPEAVQHGWQDGIGYAQTSDVLFFQLLLDESAYSSLESASADVYGRLLPFLAD